MVRSPGMYFLAFLFFLFWESCIWKVEADGSAVQCYVKNSVTGESGYTHSCERGDKTSYSGEWYCKKDLSDLVSEAGEIIKTKLIKDLKVSQARMFSAKSKLVARPISRYYDDTYPNDRYACATIAITVKYNLADNKYGQNKREVEHSVELRGIYWGDFKSEGDGLSPDTNKFGNLAKERWKSKCKNEPQDYGVYGLKDNGEEVMLGKGQIFFCPCFDQDKCNKPYWHNVPYMNPDPLNGGNPLYKGILADMVGVKRGDKKDGDYDEGTTESSTEEGGGDNAQPRITGSGLTLTIATFLIHLLQN